MEKEDTGNLLHCSFGFDFQDECLGDPLVTSLESVGNYWLEGMVEGGRREHYQRVEQQGSRARKASRL